MSTERVELREIAEDDVGRVAGFLHAELNERVPVSGWTALLSPPWGAVGPNRGFQLLADGRIVGAYAAVYSTRGAGDDLVTICNLAAFCVLDDYRMQSIRLIRALLGQRGYEFTDLSPSGNVVALNDRLGFTRLDTATRLSPNLPAAAPRGITVTDDPARLHETLRDRDAVVYADHADAPAARHLLVTSDDSYAHLIFRKDRRKGMPVFATPLHVGGDRSLLERSWPAVASRLLLGHGAVATLAERRVLGFLPRLGRDLAAPRAKMFRGSTVSADDVDYLYSELTLVEW